jgi:YVTN family beta-propeller protein
MLDRQLVHAALLTVLALGASASSASSAVPAPPSYHVAKTVPLGSPDRWDNVVFDPASKRVFIAHGDRVTVVNGRDGTVLGNIEGFDGGTHDVAVSPENGRGYTDDGRAGIAASFDLTTFKVGNRIKAALDADGITRDPHTGHIFVINADSGNITVIDPKSDSAITTIDVGSGLEFGTAGDNGKIYVNGAEKHEIVRIDTASNKIDARWPMAGCERPHGIAIDLKSHRLFSSCANAVLVVLDTTNGAVVATLPIGKGTDGAAFDPKRHLIFSSNGRDGTLSVIEEKDPKTFVSRGEIKTALSARTMTIDPQTGRLYLVAADIDVKAAATPNRRPPFVPGSTKLIMLDPGP